MFKIGFSFTFYDLYRSNNIWAVDCGFDSSRKQKILCNFMPMMHSFDD